MSVPIVRKVFKGIQVLHPAQEKRGKPLLQEQLAAVGQWLEDAIKTAKTKTKNKRSAEYVIYGTGPCCCLASGVVSEEAN